MKSTFNHALKNKVGFQGFRLSAEKATKSAKLTYKGENWELKHGTFFISEITACTNTSNSDVIFAVGLVARNVIKKELKLKPNIQASMSLGSEVISRYFEEVGVQKYLDELGFTTAWYWCMTCIGNSGELPDKDTNALKGGKVIATAVLSRIRNFEKVVHPLNQVSYLASPPLCAAYALAGSNNDL